MHIAKQSASGSTTPLGGSLLAATVASMVVARLQGPDDCGPFTLSQAS